MHQRERWHQTPEAIETLVQAFQSCTLPRQEWTHPAHLTVALWYLLEFPVDQAIAKIRQDIQRYNQTVGLPTTRDGGYHETLTLFWIKMVRQFLQREADQLSLVDLAHQLIQTYGDSHLPYQYYSRDRLMSWEARNTWLEPDLQPLQRSKTLMTVPQPSEPTY